MEPNSELTRMLKEAQQGPSSSSNGAIAASAGNIDLSDEDKWCAYFIARVIKDLI